MTSTHNRRGLQNLASRPSAGASRTPRRGRIQAWKSPVRHLYPDPGAARYHAHTDRRRGAASSERFAAIPFEHFSSNMTSTHGVRGVRQTTGRNLEPLATLKPGFGLPANASAGPVSTTGRWNWRTANKKGRGQTSPCPGGSLAARPPHRHSQNGFRRTTVMILPQVHLRKPCYDFYFL